MSGRGRSHGACRDFPVFPWFPLDRARMGHEAHGRPLALQFRTRRCIQPLPSVGHGQAKGWGMTEKEWRPFYARLSEDGASSFVRLNEGVSEWLRESLWEWLSARMKHYVREQSNFRGATGRYTPITEKIRRAERVALNFDRVDWPWRPSR